MRHQTEQLNAMMASSKPADAPHLELGLSINETNGVSDADGGTAIDRVIDFLNPPVDMHETNAKLDTQVQKIEDRVNHVEVKVNAVHDKVEEITSRPEVVNKVSTPTSSPSPRETETSFAPIHSEKTIEDLTAELADYL